MMSVQGLAKPSRTALGVAIRRASHQLYDARPLVFDDPIAVQILGERYRPALEEAAASIQETFSVSMRAWLVVRNRLAEDNLARAVRYGVRQYVLLGAGLDTFAHRNPHPGLQVFEVDHPATQQWKRDLALSNGLPEPSCLHYVPVDFEHQDLAQQLAIGGLDFCGSDGLCMAWGVVSYPSSFSNNA
jgi:methyltransferase (TIGR00027 family)